MTSQPTPTPAPGPAAGGPVPLECSATQWLRENLDAGSVLTPEQIDLISAYYLNVGSALESGDQSVVRAALQAGRTRLFTPRRYPQWSLAAAVAAGDVATVHAHHAAADDHGDRGDRGEEPEGDDFGVAFSGVYVVDDEPEGDLLARIDALTGDMCVCGCRRRVKPNGASEFFAGDGCQKRWHAQNHADNPQEVQRRPSAAQVYLNADHLPVPLLDPDGEEEEGEEDDDVATAGRGGNAGARAHIASHDETHLSQPSCPDLHGVAYRRVCPQCQQPVIPLVGLTDRFTLDSGRDGRGATPQATLVSHRCPQCHDQLPGPAYIADVVEHHDRLTLELSDVTSRVRQVLTLRRLDTATDRAELVARTWSELERQLDRFRRAWRGTGRHTP